MTQTARRRALVPRAALVAAAVIVVLIASAVTAVVLIARSRLVEVPDIVGLSAEAAEEALIDAGLGHEVSGTRVSASVRAGRVITQDPAGGTVVAPGSTVRVVLSVGPQTIAVPDLIGQPVDSARERLVELGLRVTEEPVSSEETAAVVLEMFPAPGATASVGDTIRLRVPGGSAPSDILLPYDLTGVTVLLDPLPSPGNVSGDVPMEIARRLRSLLEAAGAQVTLTRTGTESAASPSARIAAAQSSSARLVIGIDTVSSGEPGIKVFHLPGGGDAAREAESVAHARAITRAASLPGLVVSEPGVTNDAVLTAFPGPGVRVVVGNTSSDADRARFTDPGWADQVARAIYRGAGTVLEGD